MKAQINSTSDTEMPQRVVPESDSQITNSSSIGSTGISSARTGAGKPAKYSIQGFGWPGLQIICRLCWPPLFGLPNKSAARNRRSPPKTPLQC